MNENNTEILNEASGNTNAEKRKEITDFIEHLLSSCGKESNRNISLLHDLTNIFFMQENNIMFVSNGRSVLLPISPIPKPRLSYRLNSKLLDKKFLIRVFNIS